MEGAMNFNEKLHEYAKLTITMGVNVQRGQTLVIHAPITQSDFVYCIVKEAYAAGAKLVKVMWNDDMITRLQYDLAPEQSFSISPKWYAKEVTELVEQGAAVLHVISTYPDLLKGVATHKISTAEKVRAEALSLYRAYQQADKFSWCIIAAASSQWAEKVFSHLEAERQLDALWEVIFETLRIGIGPTDPVEAWKVHLQQLSNRAETLNSKRYKLLHFCSPETDLTIELPKGHIWSQCGDSVNEQGVSFIANMPTEEVFTAPLKTGVNGTVRSTKPLSYGGNIINDFTLTFDQGRIVHIKAAQGEETLRQLVSMDEGAQFLGEVALVPHRSPISQTGLLFYNTLFDENASHHLAIGSAYAFCLEGGKQMSKETLIEHGLNTSLTHVDFMIGCEKMDVYGIHENGSKEAIFLAGDWAF